ncbi:Ribosomal protein L25/Gln-tRNA synthetase [Abeliophyllum distichum]|uniref:Ribosomal protein L25/Gln-tRNA synthetase n=1 Tax=Abeliophyllum distichum TaxID=126358 RepID=A0ABD1UIV5_9LAMI
MLIRRSLLNQTLLHHHLRRFATAALLQETTPTFDPTQQLTYLDNLPRPDTKYDETIHAVPRAISGKNISAKERKAGRVPSIVFEQEDGQHGGNKRLISVQD